MDFDLNKRWCWYFKKLSEIPHGSRNEKALSDAICRFAEEHHLPYRQDHVYNVIIDKPASPGCESAEPVILQAHIDMVCEKNRDSHHQFETDPLDLYVEDGWLRARGTTLGADDGTGVAYMLAILEDNTLKHPPLECIFTVMEEIGLLGAMELKASDLHGHQYISLDGGGVSETTVSSAGSMIVTIRQKKEMVKCAGKTCQLSVGGLLGGHSANAIHLERGNANIIAGRILKEAQLKGCDIVLSSLSGGMKENAIPREAVFVFQSSNTLEELNEVMGQTIQDITRELSASDPGFRAVLTETEQRETALSKEVSDRLLNYLFLMTHGYLHHSMAIEGLTTASLNLGIITDTGEEIIFTVMVRSDTDSRRRLIAQKLRLLAELTGLEADVPEGYPGWPYAPESRLREYYRRVCGRHGLVLKERCTHGGLECGVIRGLDPEMDIITLGPVAEDIHSPSERLELSSFDKAYQILTELLEDLASANT